MLKPLTLVLGLATFGLSAPLAAQQTSWPPGAPIKRTPLQKFEVPGTSYETVIGMAEIAPGASIGRHTHFGVEAGYVQEGELVLLVEGQPEKPLKPGESYQIAPGAVHDARAGQAGAKVIATYVVEKGKPLATPAP